jgi:hypothetical protein
MAVMRSENATYRPALGYGMRVRLMKRDHHEYSQEAAILRVLPNPSMKPENQWYDVRFESGVYGRFLERYLERIEAGTKEMHKESGGQASVALTAF